MRQFDLQIMLRQNLVRLRSNIYIYIYFFGRYREFVNIFCDYGTGTELSILVHIKITGI